MIYYKNCNIKREKRKENWDKKLKDEKRDMQFWQWKIAKYYWHGLFPEEHDKQCKRVLDLLAARSTWKELIEVQAFERKKPEAVLSHTRYNTAFFGKLSRPLR